MIANNNKTIMEYTIYMELCIALFTAAATMGVLDFVWLGVIAKKLYYDEMGTILLRKPNMFAAILFYIVYVVGAVVLVVLPALDSSSLSHALLYGGLLGFVAYATYDLTNLATLKGFSRKIVVIDLLWGTAITAVVCVVSYAIAHMVA